jgi:hypothetical protein
VYLRWLLDSESFNEWMNPNDYETEEFQREQEEFKEKGVTGGRGRGRDGAGRGKLGGGGRRRCFCTQLLRFAHKCSHGRCSPTHTPLWAPCPAAASHRPGLPAGEEEADDAGAEPSAKRRKRYDPAQPEVVAGGGQQVATGATKQQLNQIVPSQLDGSATAEDVSQGQQRLMPGGCSQACEGWRLRARRPLRRDAALVSSALLGACRQPSWERARLHAWLAPPVACRQHCACGTWQQDPAECGA